MDALGILMYWCSTGATEGFVWNKRIWEPSKRPYTSALYHILRLTEVLGVYMAIYGYKSVKGTIGYTLVGIFLYERILMKIARNRYFKLPGSIFDIGLKIPRYKWQDYLILITGIAFLIWRYYEIT